MLIQSLSSTSPLSTPVQSVAAYHQQYSMLHQQQPTTKYSIRYHISYFLPYNLDKLTSIQVSLDKSKSLQYNLKKWCIRLKLVGTTEPTPEQLAPFKLYKRVFASLIMMDDVPYSDTLLQQETCSSEWNMIQLHNKDFSQQDTLFLGRQDQVEKYCSKMRDRDMRRLMGEQEDNCSFEDNKMNIKTKMQQLQLKKKAADAQSQQQRNLGDDHQINDQDFEDIISLQSSQQFHSSSQESIVEVKNQVRKRGRPRKGSEVNYRPPPPQVQIINSNAAHTISSTSVQMNGGASSDEQSLMHDDDDDYTGFDDFSLEERAQFGKNFPKKYKHGYKPSLNSLKFHTFNGQVQKIFQATKIDPQNITYSQLTQGKLQIASLNEISDDSLSYIRSFLDLKKLFEYRSLVQILNLEIFEKHYKFSVAIDSFPNLEQDGSQTMNLRCFRHLQQAPPPIASESKGKHKNTSDNDEMGVCSSRRGLFDDDSDPFLSNTNSNTLQICPLILKFKTNFDGYWQLIKEEQATDLLQHQPLLQAQVLQKKIKQTQKVDQSTKFDDIMNQKQIGSNVQQNLHELFNDDFNNDQTAFSSSLAQLNNKLKKNNQKNKESTSLYTSTFLFDDVSTKPSISPPSAGDNSLKLSSSPQPHKTYEADQYQNINLLNDDFFTTPINHLTIIEHVPKQQPAPSPVKTDIIQQSNVVPVDVIDSKHFLNLISKVPQSMTNQIPSIKFKKNLSNKHLKDSEVEQHKATLSQNEMFDNVEDHKVYQGPDYQTKDEDLHKLIKHVRKNFTKLDFYRYESVSQNKEMAATQDIKSLIISTEAMKEKYLMYRDIIMVSPCLQCLSQAENEEGNQRFKGLMGLVIYGINGNGRNVIFSIGLVKPGDQSSLEFVLKAFIFYMGKLPKALILERNQFGFETFPTIAKILKKEYSLLTGQQVSKSLYIFSQNEPRILFCSYSVQKEISQLFDFLKREEQQLYSLLVSLPFVDDYEELELKLRELQRINWGQSLDNLKDFLRRLSVDRMLWAQCYRTKLMEKQDANRSQQSPPLPQQIPIFMGDISVTQRNVTIECNMGNHLLTQTSGEFYPREALRLLSKLDEIEYSYTNESKVVAAQFLVKLEQNEIYKKFVVPQYSTFLQQRFKFQMQKAQQYTILDQDDDMLNPQLTQIKKILTWNIGSQDRKLTYKVTLNGPQGTLKCLCGFSQISGFPCSHEFFIQNNLYSHQKTQQSLMKFRTRWQQGYESENRATLNRYPDGLMYLHKQRSYLPVKQPQLKQSSAKKETQRIDIVKIEEKQENEVIIANQNPKQQSEKEEFDELHISNEEEIIEKQQEPNAQQQDNSLVSGIKIQIPMINGQHKPIYLPRNLPAKKRLRTSNSVKLLKSSKRPKKEDSEHDYADDSDNGEDIFSQSPLSVPVIVAKPKPAGTTGMEEERLRRSKRKAKQDSKIINFNQNVLTQSSGGQQNSQKVVNPKYYLQKPINGMAHNYMLFSQSKSQQSININSQKSKASSSKKKKEKKKKSTPTDEDTDSVLNLDDLLDEMKTNKPPTNQSYSQDACLFMDEQCYSQLDKPPLTLEGKAGPRIFKNLLISKEGEEIEIQELELV